MYDSARDAAGQPQWPTVGRLRRRDCAGARSAEGGATSNRASRFPSFPGQPSSGPCVRPRSATFPPTRAAPTGSRMLPLYLLERIHAHPSSLSLSRTLSSLPSLRARHLHSSSAVSTSPAPLAAGSKSRDKGKGKGKDGPAHAHQASLLLPRTGFPLRAEAAKRERLFWDRTTDELYKWQVSCSHKRTSNSVSEESLIMAWLVVLAERAKGSASVCASRWAAVRERQPPHRSV